MLTPDTGRILDECIARHLPELTRQVEDDRYSVDLFLEAEGLTRGDLPIYEAYGSLVLNVLCPYLEKVAERRDVEAMERFQAFLEALDRATDGEVEEELFPVYIEEMTDAFPQLAPIVPVHLRPDAADPPDGGRR